MPEKLVGKVSHYFDKVGVAVLSLSHDIKIGDEIHLVGHQADFTQKVESMQIEHKQVSQAKAGDDIGLKVEQKIKPGTEVYLVEPQD